MKRCVRSSQSVSDYSIEELAKHIGQFWEDHLDLHESTTAEMSEWLQEQGIHATYADINDAWRLWADSYFGEDSEPKEQYQDEISSKEEAYEWLESNIEEYGDTRHWPADMRVQLNRLIERFGNTYFWRR